MKDYSEFILERYDSNTCKTCKHWLKNDKQHSSKNTGFCRKLGNKPSMMHKWDTTYSDSTCEDYNSKK